MEINNKTIYIERQIRVPTFTMSYNHSHSFYEIFYLRTGKCIFTINNSVYHLLAGDFIIVIPGDHHNTNYDGSISCERIAIYCDHDSIPKSFWDAHCELDHKLSRSGKIVLVPKIQKQLDLLLNQMLEENNMPDELSTNFLVLQTMLILLTIHRNGIFVYEPFKKNEEGISKDIEKALHHIAVNYSSSLTLDEVAKKVNLSPTYLSKKFKKITDVTFKEYVNYIRIHQASQMLITTDDTITKIATNCGFNSSNYFKDCFHKINGMSPRTYRKHYQTQSHDYDLSNHDPNIVN